MPIKLPIFKSVSPTEIIKLSDGLKEKLDAESMEAIIEHYIKLMREGNTVSESSLLIAIGYFEFMTASNQDVVINYIIKNLGKDSDCNKAAVKIIADLYPRVMVKEIVHHDFFKQRISKAQHLSFDQLVENRFPPFNSDGAIVIDFVSNLTLDTGNSFSTGQLNIANPYLRETNFGSVLEMNFNTLVHFLRCSKLDYPNSIIAFLDTQVGYQLKESPESVRAKIFDERLGYQKYMALVYQEKINPGTLPNFLKLKEVLAEMTKAISILSEQEPGRGSFWQSNLRLVDSVEVQTSNSNGSYRIAVAFSVADYVICDFGPTGHAIHIYDREKFRNSIRNSGNWKQKEHLTDSLSVNWISHDHSGSWKREIVNLINRIKRKNYV